PIRTRPSLSHAPPLIPPDPCSAVDEPKARRSRTFAGKTNLRPRVIRNVVTTPIRTRIENRLSSMRPSSSPIAATTSSIAPRPFIATPAATEYRWENLDQRAPTYPPMNLLSTATAKMDRTRGAEEPARQYPGAVAEQPVNRDQETRKRRETQDENPHRQGIEPGGRAHIQNHADHREPRDVAQEARRHDAPSEVGLEQLQVREDADAHGERREGECDPQEHRGTKGQGEKAPERDSGEEWNDEGGDCDEDAALPDRSLHVFQRELKGGQVDDEKDSEVRQERDSGIRR